MPSQTCYLQCLQVKQATSGAALNSGDQIWLRASATGLYPMTVPAKEKGKISSQNANNDYEQHMILRKDGKGAVMDGDTVYIRSIHDTQWCVGERASDDILHSKNNNFGEWERFIIRKRDGSGAIESGQAVSFESYKGTFVQGIGDKGTQYEAKDFEHKQVQDFIIQKKAWSGPQSKCLVQPPEKDFAINSKDLVYLTVPGRHRRLQCNPNKNLGTVWADNFNKEFGWEGFHLERTAGDGPVNHGDEVYLDFKGRVAAAGKDDNKNMVHCQWNNKNVWEKFKIWRKGGPGAIRAMDIVYLSTHWGDNWYVETKDNFHVEDRPLSSSDPNVQYIIEKQAGNQACSWEIPENKAGFCDCDGDSHQQQYEKVFDKHAKDDLCKDKCI